MPFVRLAESWNSLCAIDLIKFKKFSFVKENFFFPRQFVSRLIGTFNFREILTLRESFFSCFYLEGVKAIVFYTFHLPLLFTFWLLLVVVLINNKIFVQKNYNNFLYLSAVHNFKFTRHFDVQICVTFNSRNFLLKTRQNVSVTFAKFSSWKHPRRFGNILGTFNLHPRSKR